MFHMTRNSIIYETELLNNTFAALSSHLPPGWSLRELSREASIGFGVKIFDAAYALDDPQGVSAIIIAEVKGSPLEARQVNFLLDIWKRRLMPRCQESFGDESNLAFIVVAPFLGRSARERLSEVDISYADATGNVRFALHKPAVFIETQGASRNPWRENVPLRSLRGNKTGRVVRGFLDYHPPFGTRELASLTGCSPASTSRVADLLEREALISRDEPRGPITFVEWERLLRRWADDYNFHDANRMVACLDPRGVNRLLQKLRNANFPYAVTGSFAAIRYAPIAEPRLATIYVGNPEHAMQHLDLRPADTGANVLIGTPFDPVVFERNEFDEGITYARVTQVAADLMTAPGRGPAESEALIEWMRNKEPMWQLSP